MELARKGKHAATWQILDTMKLGQCRMFGVEGDTLLFQKVINRRVKRYYFPQRIFRTVVHRQTLYILLVEDRRTDEEKSQPTD